MLIKGIYVSIKHRFIKMKWEKETSSNCTEYDYSIDYVDYVFIGVKNILHILTSR